MKKVLDIKKEVQRKEEKSRTTEWMKMTIDFKLVKAMSNRNSTPKE